MIFFVRFSKITCWQTNISRIEHCKCVERPWAINLSNVLKSYPFMLPNIPNYILGKHFVVNISLLKANNRSPNYKSNLYDIINILLLLSLCISLIFVTLKSQLNTHILSKKVRENRHVSHFRGTIQINY